MKRLTITVRGRVQGVFFRRGAKAEADTLGLTGYARNLPSGDVEMVAEGEETRLAQFLDWCYQGTKLANVESLTFAWAEATGAFPMFRVMREGNYLRDKVLALEHLSARLLPTPGRLPRHVVIIPDGNRRWAREHTLEIFKGHDRGLSNVVSLLTEAFRLGISHLTLWGFSTENWDRSKKEVAYLMDIFRRDIGKLRERCLEENIRFRHFGRRDRLPQDIVLALEKLEEETKRFKEHNFGLALDYGGRDEILRAVKKLSASRREISEVNFANCLDTDGFPDPDFIIRTSGEQRVSGLMPWQAAYAEFYFTPVFFPDFGAHEFKEAIMEFAARERRFGS